MKIRKALLIALVATLLAAGVLVNPVAAQKNGRALFNWVIADRVLVQSGGLTVVGDTVVGAKFNVAPATTLVVTMNGTVTPLGYNQPISSTGTVNTATITVGAAGDKLLLTNQAATSIVFSDTGTLKLTGNITLGQYDMLELISDGTNWRQISTSNN